MGSTRERPKRLAEKLRQVRLSLGVSQSEMVRRLEADDELDYARISGFENGLREPTLKILLRYARLANVHMEALVDDDLDLPDKLPSPTKTEGIPRKPTPTRKKR